MFKMDSWPNTTKLVLELADLAIESANSSTDSNADPLKIGMDLNITQATICSLLSIVDGKFYSGCSRYSHRCTGVVVESSAGLFIIICDTSPPNEA